MSEMLAKVDTIPQLVEALRAYIQAKGIDCYVWIWVHIDFDTDKAGCKLEITSRVYSGMCHKNRLSSEVKVQGATPQIIYDKIVGMVETDLRPVSQRLASGDELVSVF
jgi:hypothetical protein